VLTVVYPLPCCFFRWTVREYKFDAKAVEAGKEDLKKFESKRVKQKVRCATVTRFFLVLLIAGVRRGEVR
jgi:hypothetical protein